MNVSLLGAFGGLVNIFHWPIRGILFADVEGLIIFFFSFFFMDVLII